jgi:hypothetical protein
MVRLSFVLEGNYLFFFTGFVVKGSLAALPMPNTNLANGSVVPDFFTAGLAIGFDDVLVADMRAWSAVLATGLAGFIEPERAESAEGDLTIADFFAVAKRSAPYIRLTPCTNDASFDVAAFLREAAIPAFLIESIVA